MKNSRSLIVVAICLFAIAFLFAGISLFSSNTLYTYGDDNTFQSEDDFPDAVVLPLSAPFPKRSSSPIKKIFRPNDARNDTPVEIGNPQKLMPEGTDQDSGGLIFEEKSETSLRDYGDLVDFALVQALKSLDLPIQNIKVAESMEREDAEGQPFTYKQLQISVGDDIASFVQVFKDCIIAWAGKASLDRDTSVGTDESQWKVTVNGTTTHVITLLDSKQSAKPFERTPMITETVSGPRIAIVIDDMGESLARLQQLIDLDIPLTIAVWPYAGKVKAVASRAHSNGMQVILHQPMEPLGYPKVNPGKGVLLRSMSQDEMLRIVEENLRRVPYVSGLNNHMGSALTQNEAAMYAISSLLNDKNFLVLDSLTHARSRFSYAGLKAGATTYRRNVFLDDNPAEASIMKQLKQAEHIALASGQAVVIGHPYDSTLSVLQKWAKSRDKRISLVLLRNATPLQR